MRRFSGAGIIFIIIGAIASACGSGQLPPPALTAGPTAISLPSSIPTLAAASPTPLISSPTPIQIGGGGKWIAYVDEKVLSASEGKYLRNIYKLNLQDINAPAIQLTNSDDPKIEYMHPAWSPDGKRIAYEKITSVDKTQIKSELFMMDENGQNIQKLSISPTVQDDNLKNLLYEMEPAWSSDGSKIAFVSNRSNLSTNPGNYQLFIMDMVTFEVKQVTTFYGSCEAPAWSPDGKLIAFMSNQTGNYDILVINLDGTELKQVTNNSAVDHFPKWSPDGLSIMFDSNRSGNLEIYTISLDLTNINQLTLNPAADAAAQFSPDGKYIVFQSDREGTDALYIMSIDGKQTLRITNGPDADILASWQP